MARNPTVPEGCHFSSTASSTVQRIQTITDTTTVSVGASISEANPAMSPRLPTNVKSLSWRGAPLISILYRLMMAKVMQNPVPGR